MRKEYVMAGSALVGLGMLLTGCGSGEPSVYTDDSIGECSAFASPTGSNVTPTYLATQKGYKAETDPHILAAYQAQHPDIFNGSNTSDYKIGLSTLVCTTGAGKANWYGKQENVQVLTQVAIRIATDPGFQAEN